MPDPFTSYEDSILTHNYGKIPVIEVQKLLWGRSENQIKRRAKELNLENYSMGYTKKETEYLKINYKTSLMEEMSIKLNRSPRSIRKKAIELGLETRSLSDSFRWTQKETEFLKDNYHRMTAIEIAKILHKSANSVRKKVKKIGLRKYQLKGRASLGN
jgi:hypothetical protein